MKINRMNRGQIRGAIERAASHGDNKSAYVRALKARELALAFGIGGVCAHGDFGSVFVRSLVAREREILYGEGSRPCNCGSGIHWAYCPMGSSYCG